MRYYILACMALMFAVHARAGNISGTYVGKSPNAAFLLQVVETPNRVLSGRFEQVVLPNGSAQLQTMNAIVTGVVNDQTVVLTIKPAELLGSTIPASGSIRGNFLHITGGGTETITLNLVKSSETSFDKQVRALNNNAQINHQTQINAKLEKDTLTVTQELRHFAGYSVATIVKQTAVRHQYRQITKGMESDLEKERKTLNSFPREQIAFRIGQGVFEDDQIHSQAELDESNAGYSQGRISDDYISKELTAAEKFCAKFRTAPVCTAFIRAYMQHQQDANLLARAFQHSEKIWAQERSKQLAIERQADALARNADSASGDPQ